MEERFQENVSTKGSNRGVVVEESKRKSKKSEEGGVQVGSDKDLPSNWREKERERGGRGGRQKKTQLGRDF